MFSVRKRAGTDMPTISFANPKGGAGKHDWFAVAIQLATAGMLMAIIVANPKY